MKLISVYYCPGQGDSSFDDCCTFNTPNCSLNNINCSSCYLSGSGSVFQFYPNANADISFFSVTQCSGACWAEVYETQPTTVFRHGNINSIRCTKSFMVFSQTVTMDDCYITGITGSLKLTVQGGSLIITNSVIDPWLAPCAKNSKTSGPSHTVNLLNTADCKAVYFPTDEFSEERAGKVTQILLFMSLLINQRVVTFPWRALASPTPTSPSSSTGEKRIRDSTHRSMDHSQPHWTTERRRHPQSFRTSIRFP